MRAMDVSQAPSGLSPDGLWRWDGLGWVPATAPHRSYRPLVTRPRVAAAGLLLAGLTQLVFLGALAGRLDLLGRISSGTGFTMDDAVHSDDVVRTAAFIVLGGTVIAAVPFLVWLHGAVANNLALGARGTRFGPGVAVGWWFIPIACWVMPFRVVAEAWRAAEPQQPYSTHEQRAMRPLAAVVIWWWTALALGSVMALIANLISPANVDLDMLHTTTIFRMISAGLLVAAAVLGAVVVTQLSSRQRAQHAAITQPRPAA
jgi:hypothetical protein